MMSTTLEPTAALRDQLPYPIASGWQRILHHTESSQRVRETFTCLESILRTITAIALAQLPPDRVAKMTSLTMLAKPTIGSWLTVAESAAKALGEQRRPLTAPLVGWLSSTAGANPLSNRAGRTRVRDVIQSLIEARNGHAHAPNALAATDPDWFVSELKVVTESLRWLSDFALVEVRNVATLEQGGFDVQVVPWIGDRPMPRSHTARVGGWLVENSLILCDLQSGRCQLLDPWMVVGADGARAPTPHVLAAFDTARAQVTLEDQSAGSRLSRSWAGSASRSLAVEGVSPRVLVEPRGATFPQTSAPWTAPSRAPARWRWLAAVVVVASVVGASVWLIPRTWTAATDTTPVAQRVGQAAPPPSTSGSTAGQPAEAPPLSAAMPALPTEAPTTPPAAAMPSVPKETPKQDVAPAAAAPAPASVADFLALPPASTLSAARAMLAEAPIPPSSAAAQATHPLTGRWTFRTQAYSGKKPNDFGAEYALTVHEEGGVLRATTWRIKYVDGGVPGKPSEAYAAEVALTPVAHSGRTWYVATFEFDGPTAVKPRNFAFTVAGTHILGAWMWPPDGLYGVLYGDRGEAVTQWTEQVVFRLPSFPPDAQCVAVGCDETSGAAWSRIVGARIRRNCRKC